MKKSGYQIFNKFHSQIKKMLTEVPQVVHLPDSHYLFIEAFGPFQNTAPNTWGEFHKHMPSLLTTFNMVHVCSFYKIEPPQYRAGMIIDSAPSLESLPEGLSYELVTGGKYVKYVYTGPYDNLGEMVGRMYKLFGEQTEHVKRDGFAIEMYTNDPKTTPKEELITELWIPVA